MGAIYANAAKRLPEMLQEVRGRASGQRALDLDIESTAPEVGYQYEPPWEPRS
jgi:hypothetical protein